MVAEHNFFSFEKVQQIWIVKKEVNPDKMINDDIFQPFFLLSIS